MRAIRSRLTYANVMATCAVFIALGGTGYAALTLPRNSVGSKQLRKGSVGTTELRTGAVRSKDIRNRTIRLTDVSRSARQALKGQMGPQGQAGAPGTALRAAVSSGGTAVAGNSTTVAHVSGTNVYGVQFGPNTASCVATATLATVQAGPTLEEPEAGRITVAPKADRVEVKTFAANGTPAEQPFDVTVSC
jgi:hypothetical protein